MIGFGLIETDNLIGTRITLLLGILFCQLNYWMVGVVKVETEEGSNKEVTMATEPQPTSRDLSTQY